MATKRKVPSTWPVFTGLSTIIYVVCLSGKFPILTLNSVELKIAVIVWLVTAVATIRTWKLKKKTARYSIVLMIVVMAVMAIGNIVCQPAPVKTPPTQPEIKTATVFKTKEANEFLASNGWKEGDYSLEGTPEFDVSKDKSTAGEGAFDERGVKTSLDMVNFLKSGSANAVILLNNIKSRGVNEMDILDSKNWIAVQSKIKFRYPGNTFLKEGMVVSAGPRDGAIGDIFMVFLPPTLAPDGSGVSPAAVAVRGGCNNPQTTPPIPFVLEAKDPTKDVGVNPLVADYKKDATGGDYTKGHQTSNSDGATVSNGIQVDPAADAAAAKAAADKAAAEKAAAHAKALADAEAAAKAAAEAAGKQAQPPENQDHKQATPPGDDW